MMIVYHRIVIHVSMFNTFENGLSLNVYRDADQFTVFTLFIINVTKCKPFPINLQHKDVQGEDRLSCFQWCPHSMICLFT